MKKRIFLLTAAFLALAIGVVGMSAYEAHVINVTAHIENALNVVTDPIIFGTVFPQEYLTRSFDIALSTSFQTAPRVDDVDYKIVQKLKPCPVHKVVCDPPDPVVTCSAPDDPTCVPDTAGETPHNPTGWHYLSLCQYLSKTNNDADGTSPENDISHPSYYVEKNAEPAHCQDVSGLQASGHLSKFIGDTADAWTVDLKVPPVTGQVAQDWPAGCPTVEQNDKTYGCDLWVEVTGISEANGGPAPTKVGANLAAYVTPSPCNVTVGSSQNDITIQAGVNAATAGQTVCVENDIYPENVTIDKSLILAALNGPLTGATINGSVTINANDVTVKGFNINGGSTSAPDINAIYIVANTSGQMIRDNVIDGQSQGAGVGRGILFGYNVTNTTITNNVVKNWHSSGIYINPTATGGLTFSDNDFDNNNVGIGSDAINNVNVNHNDFNGNIAESYGVSGTISGLVINVNNFIPAGAGNNVNEYSIVGTVNAENNWWDSEAEASRTNFPAIVDTDPAAAALFSHN